MSDVLDAARNKEWDEVHRDIAKVWFRLEGGCDGFSGFEPSWARLMSTLRGRFQTTKGPDVALGTFVMSRCEDPICSYYLSRCRTSVRDQAHDEI